MNNSHQPSPEVANLTQQVSTLQYQLQLSKIQINNSSQQLHAQQQEINNLVGQVREAERRGKMSEEKYNNAKMQNQSLQGQIDSMREEIHRKLGENYDYAQLERLRNESHRRQRQHAVDQNKPYVPDSSVRDAPPPVMGALKVGSPTPPPRPRNDYGNPRQYQTINPSTMAALSATYGGMYSMAGSTNNRHVSYNTLFTAPPVHNKNVLRPVSGRPGILERFGDKVKTPEDIPGTFAHAEQMVVRYQSREEKLLEITNEFEGLIRDITTWTTVYTKDNGPVDLRGSHGDKRWDLLKECVHPEKKGAGRALVSELTRGRHISYVVRAMFWKYLQEKILTAKVFMGSHPETMEKVVQVDEELRDTRSADMTPARRAGLMAIRKAAVTGIINDRRYPEFRRKKVGEMMRELRGCLLPFLASREEDGISKTEAAEELSRIALKAFDLSVKLLVQDGVFVFQVPGAEARFMASTMRLLPYNQPSQNGNKVRLCITAGVTFRDDTAGNVVVQQINKAWVLCEEKSNSTARQ